MNNFVRHISFFLIVAIFVTVGVEAQITLTGELGVDLKNYSFGSDLKDTIRTSSSDRSKSSHFLNLFTTGPIVTNRFAAFSGRFKFSGIYFSSTADDLKKSEYINPELSIFDGSTTLFPRRAYPLKFYYSRNKEYPLRFEENNRSDQARLHPSLSVNRRYDNEMRLRGSQWQFKPNKSWNIVTDYKKETTETSRIYDFGENRDLWIQSFRTIGQPWDTVFTVSFYNNTEDSLTITIINLDSLYENNDPLTVIFENIAPLQKVVAKLSQGLIEVSIDSRIYNPHTFQINIDANYSFGIIYEDPESPNDLDQERVVFSSRVKYENGGKFNNESYLEYSDQAEAFQKQTTYLTNMSNIANYEFTDKLNLDILTTYTTDQTNIEEKSNQKNSAMMNQTTLSYKKRRGIVATLIHAYNRNSSDVKVDTLTSSLVGAMHNIQSQITIPFKKYNYRIDLKNNVRLLSDDKELVDNQYGSEIVNKMTLTYKEIEISPSLLFKYVYFYKENPDQSSTQTETKFILDNKKFTNTFGDLRVKGEYTYRTRDKKNKYFLDMSIVKKFGKTYKLSLLSTQDWETYSAETIGGRGVRPSEYKASYKIDLKFTPSLNVNIGGNYMMITQKGTTIQKFGATLIIVIPKIDIPIKSFILAELRDLEGRPRQSQFIMETKITYQIRRISLSFSHSIKREKQLFVDHFTHEILAKISRQFNVL